jgi:hypothetical protein
MGAPFGQRSVGGRRAHTRSLRPGQVSTWESNTERLYLVATRKRPNRENVIGKTNGWKHILNALTVHYGDRVAAIQ